LDFIINIKPCIILVYMLCWIRFSSRHITQNANNNEKNRKKPTIKIQFRTKFRKKEKTRGHVRKLNKHS